MNFNIIENKRLNEKIYHTTHSTGLDIYIAPKAGYASQYAVFGTKYGSIDNRFEYGGEITRVPEGIAHFLEHKLFEREDGDAFSRYARTGANANAYTSFDKTCYLFSTTDRFYDSLDILLDFVQSPYFTEQTVQKEQGIIGQEIRMYDDNPGWRVLFNLLSSLYRSHPVKIDIAGTVDSISKITADLLYKCYYSFYNLNNMVLTVAGDVDPEQVLEFADKRLKPSEPQKVKSIFDEEPDSPVNHYAEQKLPVSVPLFNFGFKDQPLDGYEGAKNEVVSSILLEILGGDSSDFYRRLYDKGLINSSFGMQLFSGRSFATTIVSGESREPKKVMEEFLKETARLEKGGIDKDEFEMAKKSVYGRLSTAFDSVENIANDLAACHFMGITPFDYPEIAAKVTMEDILARLHGHFNEANAALSVILPV